MTVKGNDNGVSAGARSLLPERARGVCVALGLDLEQSPVLHDGMSAQEFLAALIAARQFIDAVTFMACALPKREAVWWSYLCARETRGVELSALDAAALAAALAWIREPSEAHRRAAKDAADATEYTTPAGLVALSVFFTGGSIAPPDVQVVEPEEHLTAQTVRSAVMAAAVIDRPQDAEAHYRGYLQTGLDVAKRKLRWERATTEGDR
ncbi:MAG: hypothetical protein GVY09_03970 [Gammaproteobacteria bacterium]|jgi:hypothetical protein|nr:hypothetical protein [Gammaproteobacteria bacterium]